MKARRQAKGEAAERELLPGQSPELLKALHILTRDGDLNADSLRKLKQVNHLARLLEPAVTDVLSRFGDPLLVDCGAGKSYLGSSRAPGRARCSPSRSGRSSSPRRPRWRRGSASRG